MRQIIGMALATLLSCCATAPVTAGGRVALTFDDGPHKTLTPRLLDILRDEGVTATFCLVGQRVRDNPVLVARMRAEGHQLCNHSWSHPHLTRGNVESQISRTDAAIRSASGVAPSILRAPYGATGSVGECYRGRPFVGWGRWDGHEYRGGDTLDWLHRSVLHVTNAAVRAHDDDIVLMHDIHATTIASMQGIIAGLKARGMSFVHASNLWRNRCGASIAGN